MRIDMAKVIVERPRYGSRRRGKSKGYRKKLQRSYADARRESIKFSHRGDLKSLNEHLGPLRRFLLQQVGRPWNNVNAEICAHLRRDSAVQDHVRDHVGDYVATNVVVINGELHNVTRWGGLVPLGLGWRYPLLYVCPQTGILKRIETRRRIDPNKLPRIQIRHGFGESFIRKAGKWYHVTLESFPASPPPRFPLGPTLAVDALEKTGITRTQAITLYGRAEIATKVRPATPHEVRKICEPLKAPNRV